MIQFTPLLPATALMELAYRSGSKSFRELLIRTVSRLAYLQSSEKRLQNRAAIRYHCRDLLSSDELTRKVQGTFSNFWRDILECAYFEKEVDRFRTIPVIGLDQMGAALQKGRGCILWESNNFGRRNLGKKVLAFRGYKVDQVHLEQHFLALGRRGDMTAWEKKIAQRLDYFERKFVRAIHTIPLDGSFAYVRTLSKVLATNGIVCSAADGGQGKRHVEVDYLGRQMKIATGMLSLAKLSGAPILSLFCYRHENGRIIVELRRIPYPSTSRGFEVASQTLANQLQELVLRFPDQYTKWPAPPT